VKYLKGFLLFEFGPSETQKVGLYGHQDVTNEI